MNEKTIKEFFLICTFFHLVLVALSAFYINVADWLPKKSIIYFYGKASGADSSYGFFAPAVGSKTRGIFDYTDKNGHKVENLSLVQNNDRETHIRVDGIFDEFTGEYDDDPKYRQDLAASLTAAIFSRYQDASYVTIRVQEFWPITMTEYRSGQRAQWSDYYVARFSKINDPKGEAK